MKHSSILNFIWMVFLSHIGQTENVMVGVLWFLLWFPECCWRFVCWTKFLKKNPNGFSLTLTIHLHKMISIFLIMLIKLLILTVTMIMFYLQEILMQKMMSLACILSLLRANHSQHVTKALRKAIIRRSKLQNVFFKKQTNKSLKAYKK